MAKPGKPRQSPTPIDPTIDPTYDAALKPPRTAIVHAIKGTLTKLKV